MEAAAHAEFIRTEEDGDHGAGVLAKGITGEARSRVTVSAYDQRGLIGAVSR